MYSYIISGGFFRSVGTRVVLLRSATANVGDCLFQEFAPGRSRVASGRGGRQQPAAFEGCLTSFEAADGDPAARAQRVRAAELHATCLADAERGWRKRSCCRPHGSAGGDAGRCARCSTRRCLCCGRAAPGGPRRANSRLGKPSRAGSCAWCQRLLKTGSSAFPVLPFRHHAACRTRARRRAKPARPYMVRLIILRRLIWP